ncbi:MULTISPECIES: helix-turn-helix transcriptional regulator [Paenarthrobacter]|uniref:Metalloregulator ArsR/SmtB family transcription factor n=1 Tax=Paenarthrobacter ureafaciens TaxID=37931 RepID=A0AAX3EPI5_PAEUR|nr:MULTISPECIES: metalloregulator ArsR/SmtB family transcription factor [Paenarthrobacter]NKR09923.1 transcriptional regulator [Arthrobacter sp. M5]NKR16738.1 transcriptional regulator [Arthrobacter sp. M6]MCW3767338.1 metalloregulator ArsR/SmtB family transcription factor [Paenarthrobacter sp. PAE-2]MDO5866912.1 metalloregulator ArsR/SmtB family transcription factor [Paenarthrobacter sp. SD-2]MDO5878043.1 metalloregulator ArsR/SmtB family transcription factor [Paenarthrobacter sp. SD-1]
MSSQAEERPFRPAPETPSLFPPVNPDQELFETAAGTLRMLAEPTRLHLLWQLAQGPKTVTELVDTATMPRTVVSQHLAKLRLSGLVDTRKDGRHVIYSLQDGHMVRLIQETINHADHQITGEPTHNP